MGQDNKPAEIHDANKREAIICDTFRRAFRLEQDIQALTNEHIQPLKDELKEMWGGAKAKLNVESKDLKLQYALYRRQQEVGGFDDSAMRSKCQDAMVEIFAALEKGQMLDFLTVLDAVDGGEVEGFTTTEKAA